MPFQSLNEETDHCKLEKSCEQDTTTGESDEDFQETIDLIKHVRFAKVHMFPYSDRPKTRASRMPNKISQEVINKRRTHLLKCAAETALNLRENYIGRTFDVLLDIRTLLETQNRILDEEAACEDCV